MWRVLVFIIIFSQTAKAQTFEIISPTEAVQLLLGPNIQFSNVQFTGDILQLGAMTGAASPFEISSGIALGTSDIQTLESGDFSAVLNNPVSGNADLLSVANSVPPLIGQSFSVSSVNDVAILEFDFVATGTALSFDFIFGSNEYLAFVNTQYNDVFGFFLSGPGITGTYQDGATNIAIIPNSNPALPVTISSVHPSLNSNYYIDNPFQDIVALNGYTTALSSVANLICGETYHIRIAIADGVDQSLDSVVFLKEGSFNVTGNQIIPLADADNTSIQSDLLIENCINGSFVLTPPTCISDNTTINITYGGTATYGSDYISSHPNEVTFPSALESAIINIEVLSDNTAEDIETVQISYEYLNSDNVLITSSGVLSIQDNSAPVIEPLSDIHICYSETELVDLIITEGTSPFEIEWSTGLTEQNIQISSQNEGEVSVNVTDFCENSVSETFNVTHSSYQDIGEILGNPTPMNYSVQQYIYSGEFQGQLTWEVSNGLISSGQGTGSIVVLWEGEGGAFISVYGFDPFGCDFYTELEMWIFCTHNISSIWGNLSPVILNPQTYSVNGPADSGYQWTVTNGVITSGQGTSSVNVIWAAEGEGTLTVIETTNTGCESPVLTITTNAVITSVLEEKQSVLSIYPNPVNDQLTIFSQQNLLGQNYQLFDAFGRVVMQGVINNSSTTLNTQALSAGVYFLVIDNEVNKIEKLN